MGWTTPPWDPTPSWGPTPVDPTQGFHPAPLIASPIQHILDSSPSYTTALRCCEAHLAVPDMIVPSGGPSRGPHLDPSRGPLLSGLSPTTAARLAWRPDLIVNVSGTASLASLTQSLLLS